MVVNVQQGVKLGRQADEAFGKIEDSTATGGNMVQEIALSTQKQAQQTFAGIFLKRYCMFCGISS